MSETYCPICSSELNDLTRATKGSFHDAWFNKDKGTPEIKYYCSTCDVELWLYPEDHKQGVQRKGWFVHTPVDKMAADQWAQILHEEEERKVFTLVYAFGGDITTMGVDIAPDIHVMISRWIYPKRGCLPHHINNTADHMIADHELTVAEVEALADETSSGYKDAQAKVKSEAIKRTREFFGINCTPNGHNSNWLIIEYNLETGVSVEYPSNALHGYGYGDES